MPRIRLKNFNRETLDAACNRAATPRYLVGKKPLDEAVMHSCGMTGWAGFLLNGPAVIRWALILGGLTGFLICVVWTHRQAGKRMRGEA